jgi:hypothetical protein
MKWHGCQLYLLPHLHVQQLKGQWPSWRLYNHNQRALGHYCQQIKSGLEEREVLSKANVKLT